MVTHGISFEDWSKGVRPSPTGPKRAAKRSDEEYDAARERQAARMKELKDRIERENPQGRTGNEFLELLAQDEAQVSIRRFHGDSVEGVIREVEPLRITLRTELHEAYVVAKLRASYLCRKEDEDGLLDAFRVDPGLASLRQFPPRLPKHRDPLDEEAIKARIDEQAPLTLTLHDGVLVTGVPHWMDRFQLLLEHDGRHAFVFRHAIYRMETGTDTLDGEGLKSLREFLAEPVYEDAHPSSLGVGEVFVPEQFDDFPIRDRRYTTRLEHFRELPDTMKPITIRREGERYVLVDGYRRLTVARDLEWSKIPVAVTWAPAFRNKRA